MKSSSESKLDAALDREIEALFAVEPGPEFLPRVRARIARTPAPSPWRLRWILPISVAMAASVVLALLLFQSREAARIETPPPQVAVSASPVRPGTADVPSPIVSSPSPKAKALQQQPAMFVAPNEAAALRRLLEGPLVRFPGGLPESPAVQSEISEIEIKPLATPMPIVIAPIELPAPASEMKGVLQ